MRASEISLKGAFLQSNPLNPSPRTFGRSQTIVERSVADVEKAEVGQG